MEKIADLRKLDAAALLKKISESKKAIFDNTQKHMRGEVKDVSFFRKTRHHIAQMFTVLTEKQNKQEEKK